MKAEESREKSYGARNRDTIVLEMQSYRMLMKEKRYGWIRQAKVLEKNRKYKYWELNKKWWIPISALIFCNILSETLVMLSNDDFWVEVDILSDCRRDLIEISTCTRYLSSKSLVRPSLLIYRRMFANKYVFFLYDLWVTHGQMVRNYV